MIKKIVLTTFITASLFACKKDDNTTSSTSTTSTPVETETKSTVFADSSGLSANEIIFYQELLNEINYARTNPVGYAKNRLTAGSDNGAIADLNARTPVATINNSSCINSASRAYGKELGDNNRFSHTGLDGKKGKDRVATTCYAGAYQNEALLFRAFRDANIDTQNPKTVAQLFIAVWIIDEGVANVGHRNSIMNANHLDIGMGYYGVSGRFYGVLNFGKS